MADQPAKIDADGVSSSTNVAASLASKPSGPVVQPASTKINPSKVPAEEEEEQEDEEVEYEEYEVDEDEEIDEEEVINKKQPNQPSSMGVNSLPMAPEAVPPKAKLLEAKTPEKNPIEYEDEDVEYEEEEVEYEDEDEEAEYEDDDDDDDGPDPMADKIHELLNKATSLKQDAQQSKTINENKLLTSIVANTPAKDDQAILMANNPKHSLAGDMVVGTLPKIPHQNPATNLAAMKHCSNKWDITNLNDDEQGEIRPPKTSTADSDYSDDDYETSRNANEMLIKNPIIRQKLNIHKAMMAQKNKSIYDRHDDEEEEDDIGEIEVALEENFIEEVDEEYESKPAQEDEEAKKDRTKQDTQQMDDGGRKTLPSKAGDHDDHEHRTQRTETNISATYADDDDDVDSKRNFAKEFIKDILDVAAAEARELIRAEVPLVRKGLTTTAAAAAAAAASATTPTLTAASTGADQNAGHPNPVESGPKDDPKADLERRKQQTDDDDDEDPYAIVPELLPNIQNTDLSKKYSIDLTHVDPKVLPSTVATGGRFGPSNQHDHDQQQQQQQQQDGAWQTIMKHIIIAFIIYLGFKYLFSLIF